MSTNTTNYGWAYVHPTLGIGLTRGPERSITFQNSANADIDANGMGQASGSANLTYNSTTSVVTLAGSIDITENDATLAPLKVRQDGNGDIVQIFDGSTEVFTILNGGNVGIGVTDPDTTLEVLSTTAQIKTSYNATKFATFAVDSSGDLTIDSSGTKTILADDLDFSAAAPTIWPTQGDNETLTIGSHANGKVHIKGDLIVDGDTTTVNSTTITVDDPIITLGGDTAPGADDNKDRGVEFRYHNGSAAKVGFFGYDDSEGAFVFISDAANSSETFSGDYGNITANGFSVQSAGAATAAIRVGITADGEIDTGTGNLTLDSAGGTVIVDDNLQIAGDVVITDSDARHDASPTLHLKSTDSDSTDAAVIRFEQKSAIEDDTNLGEIWWYGDDNSDDNAFAGAYIIAEGDGAWTDSSAHPTRMRFGTTSTTIGSNSDRMVIKGDGKIGIGTDSPATELEVAGTVSADALQVFDSADASVLNLTYNESKKQATLELPSGKDTQLRIKQSSNAPDADIKVRLGTVDGTQSFKVEASDKKDVINIRSDGISIIGKQAFTEDYIQVENATNFVSGDVEVFDIYDIDSTEILNDGDFSAATNWAVTGEFAVASNKAVYTHTGNGSKAGTLTQVQAKLASDTIQSNSWYVLEYKISDSAIPVDSTLSIGIESTSGITKVDQPLDSKSGDGTYKLYFKTNNTPADFIITVASTTTATNQNLSFKLDDLSLKRIKGGDLIVNGSLQIGGATIDGSELAAIDGATSATSTTVEDADRVVMNDGGVMKQVAVTDLAAYFDDEITAMPNLTSVGTLASLAVTGDLTVDTGTLKVDSSNDRVGIGTSSPDTLLHIKSVSPSKPVLKIENQQGGSNPVSIQLLRNTTSPADDDFIGQIDFRSKNDAGSAEEVLYAYITGLSTDITDGTEDGEIQLHTMAAGNMNNTMTLQSGKVGIGTSSPSQKLEIDSGHILLSNNYGVWFNDTQTGIEGRGDTDVLRLITGNVARMTVLAAGNVGIGTATPSTKLQVAGTVTATAFAGNLTGNVVGNVTGNVTGNAGTATTAGTVTTAAQPAITSVGNLTSLVVDGDLTVDSNVLKVDTTNNKVGIGTASPTQATKLEILNGVVNGNNYDVVVIDGDTGNFGGQWISNYWANSQQGRIGFWGNSTTVASRGVALIGGGSTPQLFVNGLGNTGIGVTDPDHKLEVNGAIHISGEMTTPATPANGDGGVLYAKTDGRLFWRSHEVDAEVSTGCTACSTYDMAIIDASSINTPTTYNIGGGGGKTPGFQLSDYILAIKTGASNNNNITIELPTPSGNAGKVFVIKDITGQLGSGTQTIIISSAAGAVEPNNTGAATLNSANAAISVFSDGSNWHIF